MIDYKLARDPHISGKRYIWYKEICIGYMNVTFHENKDIDWPKYRADKTLRIPFSMRWTQRYKAYAYPYEMCGSFDTAVDAVTSIIENHKSRFDILNKDKNNEVAQ
jgi:hypothetical protein